MVTFKVASNEVGGGCTYGHIKDIQPCPINYVYYRGVARSVHYNGPEGRGQENNTTLFLKDAHSQ